MKVSMNERKSGNKMAESNNLNSSQRRRSARLSSSPQDNVKPEGKMALASVAVKRRITVRKIAPRKTVAPSEHDKENTPRRSGPGCTQREKQKVVTPVGPVPARRDPPSSSSAKKKTKEAVMPSPILPSTPLSPSHPQPPAADPEYAEWSHKVRRSYSRLSNKSSDSPDSRKTMFGFETLQTPEVIRSVGLSKSGLDVSGPLSGLSSFTSLLEADDDGSALPEPDTDIPGVAVVKERRKRRKIRQMDASELDAMAAKMNAEFEEAEVFELTVE